MQALIVTTVGGLAMLVGILAVMVKAGVYLVALLAPGFAAIPGWRAVVLTLGALTMLLGGWRALRQVRRWRGCRR